MTVNDLENAVASLPPVELQRFREWFLKFDSEQWDRQIEDDACSGKLDALAEAALEAHRTGKTQEL